MPSLTDTVETLLWEDESTTLDFKEAQYSLTTDNEKGELLKDILAFANAFRRDSAYILLGIRDTKGARSTIVGVSHHLNDADLQQFVNSKTNRTVDFSYNALELDNRQVGILRIPRQARPTYLKKDFGKLHANTVYLRHGSSTSIATPDEIARMGIDRHPNDHRYNPEITALQAILHHARFYERIIRLWENITRIPHHYIMHNPRPAEYERERRRLHVQFNADYDAFRQAIVSARDLLTQQQAHSAETDAQAIAAILTALRDVEQTVSTLASWTKSRLDTELPSDKQREAAQAADTLSKLAARRFVALGATS